MLENIMPRLGNIQTFTSTQGTYESKEYFFAKGIYFPDFCKSRQINNVAMRTFDSITSRYDVIIRHDLLAHGFILDHSKNSIS